MTFVNELIPENEKLKFKFHVNTRPDGSKPTLWKWVIDREQCVYLVVTNVFGGGYEGTPITEHYVMDWMGELIFFQCNQQSSGSITTGQFLLLRVHHLIIPQTLKDKKNEVIKLIIKALDAKDWPYRRSSYVDVNIQFDSNSLSTDLEAMP